MDMTIDVGRVINSSILQYVRRMPMGNMPYPTPITALCSRPGVTLGPDEQFFPPQASIVMKRSYHFPLDSGLNQHATWAEFNQAVVNRNLPPPPQPTPLIVANRLSRIEEILDQQSVHIEDFRRSMEDHRRGKR